MTEEVVVAVPQHMEAAVDREELTSLPTPLSTPGQSSLQHLTPRDTLKIEGQRGGGERRKAEDGDIPNGDDRGVLSTGGNASKNPPNVKSSL